MTKKINPGSDELCKLAIVFDLGEHTIGEVTGRVMLVKGKHEEWNLRNTIGPMNVWGLDTDGVWKYKTWASFRTPREAIEAFNSSLDNPKWAEMDKTKDEEY